MKINLITPEDIATFDQIDRDCLRMHVCPPPKTFINMKVHMPNGELVHDLDMLSRSWVRHAYNVMACQFMALNAAAGGGTFGAGKIAGKSISGLVIGSGILTIYDASHQIGGIGVDDRGIVIGTGNTAESFESYTLVTRILNGITATKMTHNAQSAATFSYDAGTKKATSIASRIFNNNSGAQIDVKEVGWYVYDNPSSNPVMLSRDLLSPPVPVVNTAQLTVTYISEMTFPA